MKMKSSIQETFLILQLSNIEESLFSSPINDSLIQFDTINMNSWFLAWPSIPNLQRDLDSSIQITDSPKVVYSFIIQIEITITSNSILSPLINTDEKYLSWQERISDWLAILPWQEYSSLLSNIYQFKNNQFHYYQ